MEFQYNRQTQAYVQRRTDPDGEMQDFGDENDSFMEEITRQILLLTADEEESIPGNNRNSGFSSTSNRGSDGLRSWNFSARLQPGSYFYWCERDERELVPAWMVSLWRKGNGTGTGVFIPETKSRRRYKLGKMNNGKRRAHRN